MLALLHTLHNQGWSFEKKLLRKVYAMQVIKDRWKLFWK